MIEDANGRKREQSEPGGREGRRGEEESAPDQERDDLDLDLDELDDGDRLKEGFTGQER